MTEIKLSLPKKEKGFSLVEMAIILVIIMVMLGGALIPMATQRESSMAAKVEQQMEDVKLALLGFAAAEGRLPCPAISPPPVPNEPSAEAGGGSTNCTRQHGFVPAATLGLNGPFNQDGFLVDPWNNPLRYSITASNADGDGRWDFVRTAEMKDVGINTLNPNLVICDTASSRTDRCSSGTTLASNLPVVILSMGKDWANFNSADQIENSGEVTTRGYRMPNNLAFVSKNRNDSPGSEYDDYITWISPNILYFKMLQAGQLP